MKHLHTLLILGSALLLSSCYTNFNQAYLRKEYDGYLINVPRKDPAPTAEKAAKKGAEKNAEKGTEKTAGKPAESTTETSQYDKPEACVPAVLYRCGEDWYIAAIRCKTKAVQQFVHPYGTSPIENATFTLTPLPGSPVFYHKITAKCAQGLLSASITGPDDADAEDLPQEIRELMREYDNTDPADEEKRVKLYADRLVRWAAWIRQKYRIELAEGGWQPTLPEGAVAVPAPLLEQEGFHMKDVYLSSVSGGLNDYILAGLTFTCIDLPFNAVGAALGISVGAVSAATAIIGYIPAVIYKSVTD